MFWLSMLFLVATLLFLVTYFSTRGKEDRDSKSVADFTFVGSWLTGIASFGLLIWSMVYIVPPGTVGVQTFFGKVQEEYITEGFNLIHPLMNVQEKSVRTHSYTLQDRESISVISKDGLRMSLDVTVNYRHIADDAPWTVRNIGRKYADTILYAPTRTAVREVASKFTAQELYSTKREEAAGTFSEALRAKIDVILDEYGYEGDVVVIQQVQLRNVTIPDRIVQAIEEKLQAQEEAQKMVFTLEKERQEAERKRIEAQGIKDFQDIVRQGIDEQLLTWKGIEATQNLADSKNTKIVIFGSSENGGLPLILGSN